MPVSRKSRCTRPAGRLSLDRRAVLRGLTALLLALGLLTAGCMGSLRVGLPWELPKVSISLLPVSHPDAFAPYSATEFVSLNQQMIKETYGVLVTNRIPPIPSPYPVKIGAVGISDEDLYVFIKQLVPVFAKYPPAFWEKVRLTDVFVASDFSTLGMVSSGVSYKTGLICISRPYLLDHELYHSVDYYDDTSFSENDLWPWSERTHNDYTVFLSGYDLSPEAQDVLSRGFLAPYGEQSTADEDQAEYWELVVGSHYDNWLRTYTRTPLSDDPAAAKAQALDRLCELSRQGTISPLVAPKIECTKWLWQVMQE